MQKNSKLDTENLKISKFLIRNIMTRYLHRKMTMALTAFSTSYLEHCSIASRRPLSLALAFSRARARNATICERCVEK